MSGEMPATVPTYATRSQRENRIEPEISPFS
jgi:hypothetical protein